MKPSEIFTITKANVVSILSATRKLDEAARSALTAAVDGWFAGLPTHGGAYMFRDVVSTLRANEDLTTVREITAFAALDRAVAGGKAQFNV